MEQLPHGDAARHALVSRLLTKYLYQVTPPYRFVLKKFLLGNIRVFKREIHNGLMQKCPLKVTRRGGFGGSVYVVPSEVGTYCGQGREGKKNPKES